MSSEPFYSPNFRIQPREPRPGERLWSFQHDGEAQIPRDGDLVIGRRFDMRELATRWAERERQAIECGLLE